MECDEGPVQLNTLLHTSDQTYTSLTNNATNYESNHQPSPTNRQVAGPCVIADDEQGGVGNHGAENSPEIVFESPVVNNNNYNTAQTDKEVKN